MKPNIVMYFSPNLVKNYSHNFFPQNVAQFFSQNLVKKFTPQKFTKKMALKITKFGENLVTKFSFTNFGDILVHFIFTKFGDSLKFSPNLVNIFSIFFSPRTLGLLPLRNNLQDPLTAHQSTTAGRYMVYGVGPIAEKFYTTGIKFESDEMVKMANNHDYAQDLSVNCVKEKTTNGKNAKTAEKRKSNQVVDVRAAKKQKKRQIPTKVCTPGSFLDNLSVESSSGSDSDSASNDDAVTNDKTNSGLHVEKGRDV